MYEIKQKWIKADCWVAGCNEPTTHIMESRITRPSSHPDRPMDPFIQQVGYCRYDARVMAVSLVERYDHEYEILDIRPVVEEDFND